VYSHGSKEMVALLRGADRSVAQIVAHRIATFLNESKAAVPGLADVRVSIGFATGPSDGSTLPELLRVAKQSDSSVPDSVAASRSVH
jgi:GGDEF domain-containing protein